MSPFSNNFIYKNSKQNDPKIASIRAPNIILFVTPRTARKLENKDEKNMRMDGGLARVRWRKPELWYYNNQQPFFSQAHYTARALNLVCLRYYPMPRDPIMMLCAKSSGNFDQSVTRYGPVSRSSPRRALCL
jgi:hypothetical protein